MDLAKVINENKFKLDERVVRGIKVTHFKVDSTNEKKLKRIKGDYFSINFDYVSLHTKKTYIQKELTKVLSAFIPLKKMDKPLIIGLGNSSILCDSLGVNTTNKVMATNHFNDFLNIPKVALFNPEVIEKTGIRSFHLIEMVVKKLKPTIIIMIDSLATSEEDNLNNYIEVHNTGIIPGSALKDNKKIDASTFGIPVLSIGVPLVLEQNKRLYTTPNVGEIVDLTSTIIGESLNELFF